MGMTEASLSMRDSTFVHIAMKRWSFARNMVRRLVRKQSLKEEPEKQENKQREKAERIRGTYERKQLWWSTRYFLHQDCRNLRNCTNKRVHYLKSKYINSEKK